MLDKTTKDETIINNNSKTISLNIEILLIVIVIISIFFLIKFLKNYINKKMKTLTIRNEINA